MIKNFGQWVNENNGTDKTEYHIEEKRSPDGSERRFTVWIKTPGAKDWKAFADEDGNTRYYYSQQQAQAAIEKHKGNKIQSSGTYMYRVEPKPSPVGHGASFIVLIKTPGAKEWKELGAYPSDSAANAAIEKHKSGVQ